MGSTGKASDIGALSSFRKLEDGAEYATSFRYGTYIVLLGKPAFGLDRRHAAETGRGHCLAVDVVGDIACREYAGHARRGRERRCLDVAMRFDVELTLEETGSGLVSDRNENAIGLDLAQALRFDIPQTNVANARRIVRAADFIDDVIEDQFDIRPLEQPFLQDAIGAKWFAPVHKRDLACDVAQIQSFFDRRIAAADDDDWLAAKKKSIAGRAGGHAITFKLGFRRDAEPSRLGAGGNDQGVACVSGAAVAQEPERAPAKLDFDDMIRDHARAYMFGLSLHLVHEPRTLDRRGKPRIIIDICGDRQLAARLEARDQIRLKHGARGVDRGGIAGGSRSDDDHFGVRSVLGLGDCRHDAPCATASATPACGPPDPWKTQYFKDIRSACLTTTFRRLCSRVCHALTPGPRNASFWFRQVPDGSRTGFLGLAVMLAASRRPGRDRLQG